MCAHEVLADEGNTTDSRPFSPTSDLLSRKILASPGHENITLGFIQDFLAMDIEEVVITNPYDIKSYTSGLRQGLRQTIVDVSAVVSGGIQVVIEIQVGHMAGFDKRALYGVAARYVEHLNNVLEVGTRGLDTAAVQGAKHTANEEKYQALCPVYGINVLTERYFVGDDDAYRCFVLFDTEHGCGYGQDGVDLVRLAFLEIAKQVHGKSPNLLYWQQLFNGDAIDDAAPDYIRQAAAIIARQNLTAEEAAVLTAEQLWRMDREAEMDWATEEGLRRGLERGIEQGLEQGMELVAKNAFKEGASVEFVQKITGLDAATLAKLQEN